MLIEQKPLRIYIAGPYTARTKHDVEKNVQKAIDVGLALFQKGHFPFIPHLTHYVEIRGKERNNAPTWIEYMDRDLAWLSVADALYFIGRSRGADIELEAAEEAGLKVYYSLNDVPDVSVMEVVEKVVLIDAGNGKDLEFGHTDYVTGKGRFITHSENIKECNVNPDLTVGERKGISKRDSHRRNRTHLSLWCGNNVRIRGNVIYNPATEALSFSASVRGNNGKKPLDITLALNKLLDNVNK